MGNFFYLIIIYFFLPTLAVLFAIKGWQLLYLRHSRHWSSSPYSGDQQMRRWTGTEWEYRPMTEDEIVEDFDLRAW